MSRANKAHFETVHRCRFDISGRADGARADKWAEAVMRAAAPADVEYTGAGPCWNAYLVIEHADRSALETLARFAIEEARRHRVGLR